MYCIVHRDRHRSSARCAVPQSPDRAQSAADSTPSHASTCARPPEPLAVVQQTPQEGVENGVRSPEFVPESHPTRSRGEIAVWPNRATVTLRRSSTGSASLRDLSVVRSSIKLSDRPTARALNPSDLILRRDCRFRSLRPCKL